MAKTSFISLLPDQAPAKSLPYEALWRATYNSLDKTGREKFGKANVLEQTRLILGILNSDDGKEIIKAAVNLTDQPEYTGVIKVKSKDALTDGDINELNSKAVTDLIKRSRSLSSMSAKALDAQKIKETMGVGNLTDEEYLDWLENKNLYRTGKEYRTEEGKRYSLPEKLGEQSKLNMALMRTPENLEGDYNQSGFNYLINKKDYYSPDNKAQRAVDKALSLVPILPYASQAAIARQQGEIGQYDTGLLNPGVFTGGGLNALALPLSYLPGGPAIAGGLAALGSSIAKGKRAENDLGQYILDTGVGAGTGAGTKWLIGKIPFAKKLDPKVKASNEVAKAEEEYKNLMSPMLDGRTLTADEMRSLGNTANREYTNKINQAIQSGKASGVDADAFDPNREGPKYVVIPSEIWKNEGKLIETQDAINAAVDRASKLKDYNTNTKLKGFKGDWIPPVQDEGGYNPAINIARDIWLQNTGEDLNAARPLNQDFWNFMASSRGMPSETMSMVASKTPYPFIYPKYPKFDYKIPKTASQTILKNLGYDSYGKGAQLGSTTSQQFDKRGPIMADIYKKNPDFHKFIMENYNGNPLNYARDVVDAMDSKVVNAFELYKQGKLDGNTLQRLAEEYASYNIPAYEGMEKLPTIAAKMKDYYQRQFVDKFNQLRRNPDKTPFTRKPYTSIPSHINQGNDVLRGVSTNAPMNLSASTERPNPSLQSNLYLKTGSFKDAATNEDHVRRFMKGYADKIDKEIYGINDYKDPSYKAYEEALAYYGNLENPSKEAVSKAISESDAAKNKAVINSFNELKNRYRIPTAEEASNAEMNIIRAKAAEANADKFINPFDYDAKISLDKVVNDNLIGTIPAKATYYKSAMSKPEEQSFETERSNETSASKAKLFDKVPLLRTMLYLDEAKKRGNYVPESNLEYVIPDILKAR